MSKRSITEGQLWNVPTAVNKLIKSIDESNPGAGVNRENAVFDRGIDVPICRDGQPNTSVKLTAIPNNSQRLSGSAQILYKRINHLPHRPVKGKKRYSASDVERDLYLTIGIRMVLRVTDPLATKFSSLYSDHYVNSPKPERVRTLRNRLIKVIGKALSENASIILADGRSALSTHVLFPDHQKERARKLQQIQQKFHASVRGKTP